FWARQQPMGARYVYAIALGLSGSPTPDKPLWWADAEYLGPEVRLTPSMAGTLWVLRSAAVMCAVLGFALIALRLGWPGAGVALVLLGFPQVRSDLARAWAEGPL